MKAHAMFLSVASLVALVVLLSDKPQATAAARIETTNKELKERVEKLEKALEKRERSPELALLRARVTELERLMREARGGSLTMAPKADLRDVSSLQRDHSNLQRTVMSLENKLGRLERADSSRSSYGVSMSSIQRDLGNLKITVSTLRSRVDSLRQ